MLPVRDSASYIALLFVCFLSAAFFISLFCLPPPRVKVSECRHFILPIRTFNPPIPPSYFLSLLRLNGISLLIARGLSVTEQAKTRRKIPLEIIRAHFSTLSPFFYSFGKAWCLFYYFFASHSCPEFFSILRNREEKADSVGRQSADSWQLPYHWNSLRKRSSSSLLKFRYTNINPSRLTTDRQCLRQRICTQTFF